MFIVSSLSLLLNPIKWLIETIILSSICHASRTIAPRKIALENCPLTIKFLLKIIAPTQVNSPQRVLRMNWGKLCIVHYALSRVIITKVIFQVCNLGVKLDWLSYVFTDVNQNLQNMTYKITPFAKRLLIFLRQSAKKFSFSEKLIRKKIQKNFIVNNHNKVILPWIYLPNDQFAGP